jgi:alkylation response protein AidB-like acyl-CoA dehydrogenase
MAVDLQPTDEQRALVETLHEFASDVLRPAARSCEAARSTTSEISRQVHAVGVSAAVAERFGGGGELDPVTYCMVAEELAWGDPGIAYQLLGSGLAATVIGVAGSDEQRARYLPQFAGAEPVAAFVAVGEKIAAGDLGALDAAVDGDKVVGEKYGVLNAGTAPLGVVVGRTGSRLGAVVLGAGDFEVVKPEDKMGLEAAPTSVVRFDSAGDALAPGPRLDAAILWTKLLTGALAVGCARASLEYASAYAIERQAFGKPIGAFQGVSFKIADMAIAVDSARLSLWRAAWNLANERAGVAHFAASVGQALVAAVQCGDDGVQVLGGHGYIRDHPVEKWFRDAVTLSVFDAPDVLGDLLVMR